MTKTSLAELARFLNAYKSEIHGRIADYGGSTKIGGDTVRKGLAMGGLTDLHILDMDTGYDLMKPIKGKKFDFGICMNLLEHVANPFTVAKNIVDSLVPGAYLFVTVPWIWEIHDYPKDYWRICPDGMVELFKEMEMVIVYIIRDQADDEEVQRQRVVAVFKKKLNKKKTNGRTSMVRKLQKRS